MKLCTCVHVLKAKRITNPKHRYDAHYAPLVYRYFRPTRDWRRGELLLGIGS